jgi:NitT/TauT family transport system substrate-binding protein
MSGPGALNEALLSGNMTFVNVALPALATLWERTLNTPRQVKALCAVQSMPYELMTRNPAVHSIAEPGPADRVAVPTVKISLQAMMLQIAAAKQWRFAEYGLGGPHTNGTQVTTEAFYNANPALCGAVKDAHDEANAFIKRDAAGAAEIYPRFQETSGGQRPSWWRRSRTPTSTIRRRPRTS